MKFGSLVVRNLLYHWRGNLAVLLGIALGSAVLTGALLVGDSLRGSLRDLSVGRLGWVEETLAPGRFFSAALASGLPAEKRAGVIAINASAIAERGDPDRSAAFTLYGVTPEFWASQSLRVSPNWNGDEAAVILNESLANDLAVKPGDSITLTLQKLDAIPRETLLGKRKADDVLDTVSLKITGVVPNLGMANFSLRLSPEPPRNAFVPLAFLQKKLDQPGKINLALLGGVDKSKPLNLSDRLTIGDWGLKLTTPAQRARALVRFLDPRNTSGELKRVKWDGRVPEDIAKLAIDGVLSLKSIEEFYRSHRNYLLLQSDRFYLDATVEAALNQAFDLKKDIYHPSLIYLADSLNLGAATSPYATIAAVRPDQVPNVAPPALTDDEILLVNWPGSPLRPHLRDRVLLSYYMPAPGGTLKLHDANLFARGTIPLRGDADDPDWTPEYPGLTDKLDIAGWENPPFPPYSTRELMKRIKPIDEEYWKRYRATPKAYVTLATGQKLFGTRFGKLTQLRIDLPPAGDAAVEAAIFERRMISALDPARGGFVVQDVRGGAAQAAAGSNDFGGLFLAFSFFLIVSALMLVGLLVRLNLERRIQELGLLAATGWSPRLLRRMLRREGWVLILLGGGVGLIAARLFAALMLRLLAVNWPGEGSLQFLTLHETPATYAIGFAGSAVVSAITLRWALRMLKRLTPRQLLAGETSRDSVAPLGTRSAGGIVSVGIVAAAIVGVAGMSMLSRFYHNHEVLAAGFFGAGAFMLVGLLSLAWRWLQSRGARSDPQPTLFRLGLRNAGRNPVRSLLTVGLLAAATFLIVAVQAFHREPASNFPLPTGGSGGFQLVAETALPIYQKLDDATLADLNVKPEIVAAIERIESCRLQPGDDTSCLNLYKPLQPRLVGVPESLIRAGRFAFAAAIEPPGTNPWIALNRTEPDGSIPAILDANTAQWILKVALGGTIEIKNGAGQPVKLRVVGLLSESLFQSEIVVSEASFLKVFPAHEGYGMFLIECQPGRERDALPALRTALASSGGQVQPTIDRVAAYLAVENMYLATFQALGGFGLALGALGLAIVLVRGVWERRAELALLRAVGFRHRQLAAMTLSENAVLLLLGLIVGVVSALAAIAPHLAGGEAKLVLGQTALLLGGVALVGLTAAAVAIVASLRAPLLGSLRRE